MPKMTRVTRRLPPVLSALALVVAVLGATPYAEAHGVLHALFAHNADKVDGIHASRKPRAGNCLRWAGTGSSQLPSSRWALQAPPGQRAPPCQQGPAGPLGPEGPKGPQGPAGADGANSAPGPEGPQGTGGSRRRRRGDRSDRPPRAERRVLDLRRLDSVPDASASIASLTLGAGSYVVWGKAWFQNGGIGTAQVTCTLETASKLDEMRLTLTSGVTGAPRSSA